MCLSVIFIDTQIIFSHDDQHTKWNLHLSNKLTAKIFSILFNIWTLIGISYVRTSTFLWKLEMKKNPIQFHFDDNYSRVVHFWSKVKPLESVIIDHCSFFLLFCCIRFCYIYLNCYIRAHSWMPNNWQFIQLIQAYTKSRSLCEKWDYKFHLRFFYWYLCIDTSHLCLSAHRFPMWISDFYWFSSMNPLKKIGSRRRFDVCLIRNFVTNSLWFSFIEPGPFDCFGQWIFLLYIFTVFLRMSMMSEINWIILYAINFELV